jgi:endonuclease-3 related protein
MTGYPQPEIFKMFNRMIDFYGPLSWWPAETAFEVCIGAILTQNTAWTNVEKAISELKAAGALTQEKLLQIDQDELAGLIRSAGFFNIKSRRVKAFVGWLDSRYGGSLEQMFAGEWQELRRELLQVNGIGPETCDAIMLYAGHKPSFVVDNYTRRLFQRLGLLDGKERYEEIRSLFMNNIPEDVTIYNEYHAVIVEHCKQFCRKKPICNSCPLKQVCSYAVVEQNNK